MPSYDYLCKANNRVIEVRHRMNEKVGTWGQLCDLAGIEPGDTPLDAPVEKLITGGNVIASDSLKNPEPACAGGSCNTAMPACCGGGACAMEDF